MGCNATNCNSCKRKIKSCEKTRSKKGTSCCVYCVSTVNVKEA